MRLVMKKNVRSLRRRIMRHASVRQGSASSSRKSDVKHVYTQLPGAIFQSPPRVRRSGKSNACVRRTTLASR